MITIRSTIPYYEPGDIFDTVNSVTLPIDDDAWVYRAGSRFRIPEGLYKVISTEIVGATQVTRTAIGYEGSPVYPVCIRITDLKALDSQVYICKQGIQSFIEAVNGCTGELTEAKDTVLEAAKFHLRQQDDGLEIALIGADEDHHECTNPTELHADHADSQYAVSKLADTVKPYMKQWSRNPQSYRDSDALNAYYRLLDLGVPKAYEPCRFDTRTSLNLDNQAFSQKDYLKYLVSNRKLNTIPLRVKELDWSPLVDINESLMEFLGLLQASVLDEINYKYILFKGKWVIDIEYGRGIYPVTQNLDNDKALEVLQACHPNPYEMLYGIIPDCCRLIGIEVTKTCTDKVYIILRLEKGEEMYVFVDLTLVAIGSLSISWRKERCSTVINR